MNNETSNSNLPGSEMYAQNLFKGQKILIVMPYDATMNLNENPKILPKYLSEPSVNGGFCVKDAVGYYGIEIKVVQNYKDAINELTKQTIPGKCDYYAIWILSGPPYDIPLADGGNQNLIIQFIECAIQFWEKGGSVILFAENDPLTFQVNLFLKLLKFPDQSTTQLQISGSHYGTKTLVGDETGILDPGTFNKSPNVLKKFQRPSLNHNIHQLYEGKTFSFDKNDKDKYWPFIPFIRDSEGGITSLFYCGDTDLKHKTGDIIINCGYAQLFDSMEAAEVFKFVKNIAAWTMQYESKLLSMKNPEQFHLDAIEFVIDEAEKYDGFIQIPSKNLGNTIFAIDYSGSTNGIDLYHNEVRKIFDENYKDGDAIVIWDNTYEIIDRQRMEYIICNKIGRNGTDPSQIALALASNPSIQKDHLILVTDGSVDCGSIDKCDQILRNSNIHFKYVTIYIIGNGDLSVGVPFTRCCQSKIIEIKPNSKREYIGANSSDFASLELIDQINDIDHFKNLFQALFNATKQKMIGTNGNDQLKIQYEKMRARINQNGNVDEDGLRKMNALIKMASGAIKNVFNNDLIDSFGIK